MNPQSRAPAQGDPKRSVSASALGESYNPFVPPQLDDPEPVWAVARAERPVFYNAVLDAWVVTRYDDVVRILRDHDTFGPNPERRMFGAACPEADAILAALPKMELTNPLSSSPPVHTQLRRYLQAALAPRRLAAREDRIRAIAHAVIDEFERLGGGDLHQLFIYPFPLRVVGDLIGIPDEDLPQVKRWSDSRFALRYGSLSPQEQTSAARDVRDFHEYTMELVAMRRARPGDDLMSWIVEDSDASDDPLSDEQLASQASSLMTGGHETTAHWVTMVVHRLVTTPGGWAQLVDEPASAASLVEESLRVDGPVQCVWRRARVGVEVGGADMPPGAKVAVVLGAANLDDSHFACPAAFEPERPNASHHLAFGRGIHTCVGAGLARLEGRVGLEALAARLPRLRASHEPLAFSPSATMRAAHRLLVEWS